MKYLKNDIGITVIGLVITIIVLLILVGVVMNSIAGENRILNNLETAKTEYSKAQMKEELELNIANLKISYASRNEILSASELSGYKGALSSKESSIVWITDTIGIYKGYHFEIDENLNINFVEFTYNYDSVQDMKENFLSLSEGDIVTTKAYYKNGALAGAGTYEIKSDNGSFNEDGGMYIKLNETSDLWAVLKIYDDTVNIYQYGAYGDGVTDDTNYVQKAFNSKASYIYVSDGKYVISSKIIIASNKIIIGTNGVEDAESLFIASSGLKVGSDIFSCYENSRNIIIKGISISGNSEFNTRDAGHSDEDGIHLLDFWKCTNILIDNCIFKDNIYAGIRIMGGKDITIKNSKFINIDCGVITLGDNGVTNLYIENNIFEGHEYSEPIALWSTNTEYKNINIIGNTMSNKPYANSILFRDTNEYKDVIIENNTTYNMACGFNLCNISGESRIVNNTIETTVSGNGVILKNCKDIEIDNLKITNSYLSGISIDNSQNLKITNLVLNEFSFRNSNFCGINLTGDGTGTFISGDVICSEISLGNGLNVYGNNYDISGLKFDIQNGKNAIVFYNGASKNIFHTNQCVSIVYEAGNLSNDIIVNNTAFLLKGTDFNSYFYRFVKKYEVTRLFNSDYSLSTMYPCQNGFEREIIIHAGVRVKLISATGNNSGDIVWLNDRILNDGEIEIIRVVCQNGIWYELE